MSKLFVMMIATGLMASPAWADADSDQSDKVETDSGLVFESLEQGDGASPGERDVVSVHYRGTFLDGEEFDSSYARGEPTQFPLNRVIECWTEGVQMMQEGGKARLTCPPEIAYGSRGAGRVIPPDTTLQFEIELLEVK